MRIKFLIAFLSVFIVCAASAKIDRDGSGYVLLATNSGTSLLSDWFLEVGGGMSKTEPEAQTVITRAGTLKNLFTTLTAPPGDGATRTFTVRKNGMNTPLVVTFRGATAMKGCDTADSVPVLPYDLISVQNTSTGSPAASVGVVSFELLY
jgi:hypothetical protein